MGGKAHIVNKLYDALYKNKNIENECRILCTKILNIRLQWNECNVLVLLVSMFGLVYFPDCVKCREGYQKLYKGCDQCERIVPTPPPPLSTKSQTGNAYTTKGKATKTVYSKGSLS